MEEREWISVEDRLPELGSRVFMPTLVYRKENLYPTTRLYVGKGQWNSNATITHWMPIPDPPKDSK